ncbi:MAG: hypothetical protein EAZ75_04245 [Flavobacteriia bacterium]|jgi:hypothetical protein|uniref:hypothetical protein n=1 Tax=Flavobacterium sp. TaxID=239 RepID=UPI0029783A39|nr:MAG: hypothetical protein EAZ75_04245 [Flavobacteriia bacterium]
MFKDIQKKLLLKYPLLWNTKFVPMVAIGLLLHLIFFGLGYLDGTIDFSNRNNLDIEVTCILFGVLLVIIIIILWLINYFKNNSLKSFYSKSKYSLFYEWLQIFVVSALLITFYIPFSVGKQLHQKNYYSLEETTNRCKTIATADMFIDGSFGETEIDSLASGLIDSLGNKVTLNYNPEDANTAAYSTEQESLAVEAVSGYTYKNHIIFNGKKYDQFSLVNRNTFEFTVISREQDSLNKIQVQNWLHQDNQAEVKKLMDNYLSLIREHDLATNLNMDKWFEIVYKAPESDEFLYIQPYLKQYETDNSYNNYDYATKIGNGERKYSKYFVQQDVLKDKYDMVSEAHTDSFFKIEIILGFLYGAFGLSILIFSFRVTTGKSWLIAVVTTGVINIVYGILTAITGVGDMYAYLILFTILGIMFYFFLIYFNKKNLQLSRIALNLFLWSFIGIIPLIYFLIQEHYLRGEHRYNYNYTSPEYEWMEDHVFHMFCLNFVLSILTLFFLSKVIRTWKGISED